MASRKLTNDFCHHGMALDYPERSVFDRVDWTFFFIRGTSPENFESMRKEVEPILKEAKHSGAWAVCLFGKKGGFSI